MPNDFKFPFLPVSPEAVKLPDIARYIQFKSENYYLNPAIREESASPPARNDKIKKAMTRYKDATTKEVVCDDSIYTSLRVNASYNIITE